MYTISATTNDALVGVDVFRILCVFALRLGQVRTEVCSFSLTFFLVPIDFVSTPMCRPQHEKLPHFQRRHRLGHVSAEVSLAKFLVVQTTKTWIFCNYTLVSPHLASFLQLPSSIAWGLPHAARLYTTKSRHGWLSTLAPWDAGLGRRLLT